MPGEKTVFIGIALVALGINPFTSFEPFNAPKFLFLLILSSMLIILSLNRSTFSKLINLDRILKILISLFLLQSVFSLLFSVLPWFSQLFGIDGRNTGFLTYFSFIVIFVYFILRTSESVARRLVLLLIIIGLINALYGLVQFSGQDPFAWTNPYSPVFGFFGNPNFQSALMGISGSAVWAILLIKEQDTRLRLTLLALQAIFFVVLIGTKSQQGFIIFFAGFVLSLFFLLTKNLRFKKFSSSYLAIVIMGGVVAILDILQKTPWNSVLYKVSVSNRGDLWRSAWNMSLDHPIFGVGFDGYEYFYRAYRDETAIVTRGAGTTSNSAHNVFLDILTTGGFPLLLLYLAMNIYVLIAITRINKRNTEYKPFFVAASTAWIAFQLQSLISINQIGIAIWGWVLGGALIGLEIKTRQFEKSAKVTTSMKLPSLALLSIGGLLGFLVGYQPMKVDINFREAIESKKIESVLNSAYDWPQSPQRMFQVAGIFRENKLDELSYKVAKDAVTEFPRSFENWEILYSLTITPETEKEKALAQMRLLDPNNNSLK